MIGELRRLFGIPDLESAPDLVAAMQSKLTMLVYSNALRAIAVEMTRILNDLRLLSSGPNTGLVDVTTPFNNLRLNTDHAYFNSGVLLIDLDQARARIRWADIVTQSHESPVVPRHPASHLSIQQPRPTRIL